MRPPFVLRSTHDAVCADRDRIRYQRDAALRKASTNEGATKTMARQNVLLSGQIEERDARIRDLTARLAEHDVPADAAALKQQLADAETRADRLQQRLDQALGLDAPAVRAGAGWQSRRQHKLPLDPS